MMYEKHYVCIHFIRWTFGLTHQRAAITGNMGNDRRQIMLGKETEREREKETMKNYKTLMIVNTYFFLFPGEVNSWPCARGGHQLCLDVNAQLIYLFGGWDGIQELSDFWVFNINGKQWKCLSRDTTEQVTIKRVY